MKKNVILGLGLALGVAGAVAPISADAAAVAQKSEQKVNAVLKSGGLKGGLDLDAGASTKDVNFGELTIGSAIPDQTVTGLLKIEDYTGGDGWNLTAKNISTDKSLALKVKVDDKTVNLNENANQVVSGLPTGKPVTYDGVYSADWGVNPKEGNFTNTIEWVLSATVSE